MDKVNVSFRLNGKRVRIMVEPRCLLVDAIRDRLGLTGTHVGCDTTSCGACAVLVDGMAIKSCTMLAVQAAERDVETVEGLAGKGGMHPVQEAFVEKHGLQCGFCTPGMVMTSKWLLDMGLKLGDEEVAESLCGNICRCTGYRSIVESVKYAGRLMKEDGKRARGRR